MDATSGVGIFLFTVMNTLTVFCSIVATDIAKEAFRSLKTQGIDLEPFAISVEQSAQSILQIVSMF